MTLCLAARGDEVEIAVSVHGRHSFERLGIHAWNLAEVAGDGDVFRSVEGVVRAFACGQAQTGGQG